MSTKTKFVSVVVVFGLISFALSRVIWPDVMEPGMMGPSSGQLPFFIFISVFESVAFGVGVAFLFFGWPMVRRTLPDQYTGAVLTFLSIAWMLISWWPHDNMHRVNGTNDLAGLLRIEYIFHFTLIIAAFIVAFTFWKRISTLVPNM